MIKHADIGSPSFTTSRKLKQMIDDQWVKYGGNAKLKIYGTLQCASGKRMKAMNRVFFSSEQEAVAHGFRPCGHCMRDAYLKWKTRKEIIPKP
ncbi:Ada metal-binding domain-containing protein [Dyadobacter psychrophilus]|uniref:Metal binding domain of Ada n=1 Tax=Dyadobacter psychrophilus TaxID=651661 RepID=A0A1T5EJX1_9BACT|nr:Ada metal-binding domain-containing protein [Dyadobacter psychrophilus]SKB84264.1 Metal binding domain of Ada [Dyadobacter psychrophilus]